MSEFEDDTEIIDSTKPVEPCWPFWGLLETIPKKRIHCTGFHRSIIFCSPIPEIFHRFSQTARSALGMLQSREIDDLRFAAIEIEAEVENWKTLYIDRDTANQDSDDGLGFQPKRDDYLDLVALQECLDFESFDKSQMVHFGLVEPEEHEFFAILALMIICQSVHSNPRSKITHYWPEPTLSEVKAIGSATICAIEAMAHADLLLLEQQIRSSIEKKQPAILEAELSRRTSERAVNAANRKHLANKEARNWVLNEWALHRDSYSGNKSEFSRIYAARVKNEFTDSRGRPLSVTDKTIREVWLKNTPTAGK